MSQRMPTLFISHGGGPWPFMDMSRLAPKPVWDRLEAYLRGIDASLPARPRAVLVVSGHWEEAQPTVNSGAHPPLLFDYYGFPEHTYRLHYPAPGSPALAGRVRSLLQASGIPSGEDAERGFDHGVFVPFMLMYPQADMPIVQLSLQQELDPAAHLAIGRALAPLRDEGVLIVGSGLSYHNLSAFVSQDPRHLDAASAFDGWLTDAVEAPDRATRDARLIRWAEAPGARLSHPREDHLLPLMVTVGAAGSDPGRRDYGDLVSGKTVSGYRFG
ncbi:MAG: DODA-type extradiol aromatic ring-opening family dioxygenase [Alphaproteobacteria bacterium]